MNDRRQVLWEAGSSEDRSVTDRSTPPDFEPAFHSLIGFTPLEWQKKLYKRFLADDIPPALDLPTGLGKTSVIPIWLIARAAGAAVPRRLVYVVDRRAVVDQATTLADKLARKLDDRANGALRAGLGLADGRSLAVSTLRGQYADNRRWLEDPTAPAIVVGTIDMVGSRLLFEGYGVSRRMRPCHAGLLGADALIVLDEAHLSPAFDALLRQVADGDDRGGLRPCGEHGHLVPRLRFLPLSATGRTVSGDAFRLDDADRTEPWVARRIGAAKHLAITDMPEGGKLPQALIDLALERGRGGARVLVYCDRRRDAEAAAKALKARAADGAVEMLVGARRVHERQKLAESAVYKRFADQDNGAEAATDDPAFLLATAAGEVGVDLDADHLVCDLVAFERLVQRLGRVNRRGRRTSALVDVVVDRAALDKLKDDQRRRRRLHAVLELLERLPVAAGDRRDASPAAFAALRDDPALADLIDEATTPAPWRPALTRATVDAWSLTSLDDHPGRPEVTPWLRGWVDEDGPQTEVVWRRYLPWRKGQDEPDGQEVRRFFEAAPPHLTERLETRTDQVFDILTRRAAAVRKEREKAVESGAGVAELAWEKLGALVLDRAGRLRGFFTLDRLADLADRKRKTERAALFASLVGRRVVVSRALGGLNANGLMDVEGAEPDTLDAGWSDDDLETVIGYRVRHVEPGDQPEADGWRTVERFPLGVGDDEAGAYVVQVWRGKRSALSGDLAVARHAQSLADHHDWAGQAAAEVADALGLPDDYRRMLIAAARWHDAGKDRPLWQTAMGAPRHARPWAKTTGGGNPRLLGGYRHEFGSLADAAQALGIADPDLRDLALHLIAAHHGFARPVIAAADPDVPPSACTARARDVALRFARLQRRWGPWGLAWWEAVFRAADWRASRRNDERTDVEPKGEAA